MKKSKLTLFLAVLLSGSILFSSCIGSFSLTTKLHGWNNNIGNKFVNELVFLAFCILPVYEISLMADYLVLNSIEFWSGSNPIAESTHHIKGENSNFLVKSHKKGYTIINEDTNTSMDLVFDKNDKSWSAVCNGKNVKLMTFIDDNHVDMYNANGEAVTIELSQAGVLTYQDMVKNNMEWVACR
ncbi:MAG: DUF3332 domain-containing protein [Coprobacter sp.]|nr:DUF3332 domain-containing protein [Coprobacter sp.]